MESTSDFHCGLPNQPIIAAIKGLYTDTQANVITADGETTFCDIEAGVLHGDTFAPFFFIIVLVLRLSLDTINDKGLELYPRRNRRQPAKYIANLDFPDDIALMSDLVANAKLLVQSVFYRLPATVPPKLKTSNILDPI